MDWQHRNCGTYDPFRAVGPSGRRASLLRGSPLPTRGIHVTRKVDVRAGHIVITTLRGALRMSGDWVGPWLCQLVRSIVIHLRGHSIGAFTTRANRSGSVSEFIRAHTLIAYPARAASRAGVPAGTGRQARPEPNEIVCEGAVNAATAIVWDLALQGKPVSEQTPPAPRDT
jgi:hypothetical protein